MIEFQNELWSILQNDEYNRVWDKIYSDFKFNPCYTDNGVAPFQFQIPVDCYDISNSPIYNDDVDINNIIKSIFVKSIDDDDFMYALDWQHTCFRYNPRINTVVEYPVFIKDERYEHGGYNVYFPKFYPNGDYYFFIAKDFSWGYLTHPWLKKVCVFGEVLMNLFKKHSHTLNFISCTL